MVNWLTDGRVPEWPALVMRAREAAVAVGMSLTRAGGGPSCCLPAVGQFLAVLAVWMIARGFRPAAVSEASPMS